MRLVPSASGVSLPPPTAGDPLPYRFMVFLAKRFPLSLGYAIGETVADIAYHVWESKRMSAQRNYATVLGVDADHVDAARLARRAFRNFGRYIVEMFHLQSLSPEDLRSLLNVRDLHYLHEALAYNRGVVFVSAHIGNMEAASAVLPLLGHQMVAAAERLRPDWVMRYMERARAQWGVTLVPVERAGRRLLTALRRKKLVALIADVGIKHTGGVRVRFFGRDTYFPAGPARFSRLSGAPLVFGCAVRNKRNGYDIIVGAPVLPRHTADETADMEGMTQQVVDQIEDMIRQYPDQWYMFRDMWPREPLPPAAAPTYTTSSHAPGTAAS